MERENFQFDASVLLSTPHFGPAIPNNAGTLILHTISTYSFETHSLENRICIVDIESGASSVVTQGEKDSEPTWLGVKDLFVFLRGQEDGKTSLRVCNVQHISGSSEIAQFDGPVSGLKVKVLGDDTIGFVISGLATSSGELHNPSKAVVKHSTGRLYTSLPVRCWDSYVTEFRNSVFFGRLKKVDGNFKFVSNSLINVLRCIPGLECPLSPYSASSDYDIGLNQIAFVSKSPRPRSAGSPASNIYLVPFPDLETQLPTLPYEIQVPGLHGASSSPVFSPDGKSLAFLRMKNKDYESDKNRVILTPDISNPDIVEEKFASEDGLGSWDRSPSSVAWSNDSKCLFVTAADQGRVVLFKLLVETSHLPVQLTREGCISSIKCSGHDETKLFLTDSTFTESSRYTLLDASMASSPKTLHSSSSPMISPSQFSEFWYPSIDEQKIHAFVVTPPDFSPDKKYPVIVLIHGGPQYAWQDNFPIEGVHNPLIFAAAGYVVFMPNVTGSIGYGQEFTDSIRNEWGGKPYIDLENGFKYIRDHLPYADTGRAFAIGASWGGYMANWLAGHPLGKEFKALVSDCGIFSTKTFAAVTDEGFFPRHDFGGFWWADGRASIDKWDPSLFVKNWTTPMLIIHSEKDSRVPISEGLAAFSVLQEREIESAFLTFEDEGHMAVQPENVLVSYEEVLKFLGRFLAISDDKVR